MVHPLTQAGRRRATAGPQTRAGRKRGRLHRPPTRAAAPTAAPHTHTHTTQTRNQKKGKEMENRTTTRTGKKKAVYAMAVLDDDEVGTPSAAATSGGTPAAACTSDSRPTSATAAADEDSSSSESARTRTAGEPAYRVAGGTMVPGARTEPGSGTAKRVTHAGVGAYVSVLQHGSAGDGRGH